MAHQSLYRRYRPATFADIVGQEHVVAALRNAVRDGRVGHAYLFSGPRGTGKTSTARILAKALNCENPVDGDADGTCASCLSIAAGTSYDLHELDAASNNKVDDIRDLVAKVALGSPGRVKVYILDEVHMLSGGAENALLKTLEEPPDHVVFVLATTEPHKVVPTIRSRTQHLRFELLGSDLLEGHVRTVAADAGLEITDADVAYVLRAGGGSVRDTLSALDEVVASGGAPDDIEAIEEIVDAVAASDTARALAGVQAALVAGRDPRVIAEQAMSRLRDAFLVAMGAGVDHISDAERSRAATRAEALGPAGLTRALETLGTAAVDMRQAPDPRVDVELALVRLTRPDLGGDLASLVARVERLEGGAPPVARERTGGGASSPATDGAAAPAGDEAPGREAPGREAPGREAPDGEAPDGKDRVPAPAQTTTEGSAADGSEEPPTEPRRRPADAARARLAERPAPDERSARAGASRPTPTGPEPRNGAQAAGSDSGEEPDAGPPPMRTPVQPDDEMPSEAAQAADTTPPDTALLDTAPPDAALLDTAPPDTAPAGLDTDGTGAPTRDEVALAWGDTVLPSLPPRVRSRFAGGRFLPNDGDVVVFGLPNEIHRDRCAEVRVAVDEALAAHFGRPVELRLGVDDGSTPVAPAPTGGPSTPADDDDEIIDPDELVDAPLAERSGLETLTKTFPGAELVDPDEA